MNSISLSSLALAASLAAAPGPAPAQGVDPITTDPAPDRESPPVLRLFRVDSGNAYVNGRALLAQGKGPHPTVVLLHGFPGLEQNMDLAQAMRRSGWNVLTFHYRGSWGSGGDFSFANVLEDTKAVVAHVRGLGKDADWRVDANRIVLVGHSVGGFAALNVGAADDGIRAVASIAGYDVGAVSADIPTNPDTREFWVGYIRDLQDMLKADPEALATAMGNQAPQVRFTRLAPQLAKKQVLLVIATNDGVSVPEKHHVPLAQLLKDAKAPGFAEVAIESDHSFNDKRIALQRAVLGWLERQR